MCRIARISIILVFSVGCSHFDWGGERWAKTTPEGDDVRYHDDRYRFSIAFPQDWEVTYEPLSAGDVKKSFTLLFSAESPKEGPDDKFQERIGVVVVDLDRFTPKEKRDDDRRDVRQIANVGFTRIQGYLARWYISKSYASVNGKVRLKQMGYDIQRDRVLYKVGWVGEAGKLGRHKPIIQKVVYSIRFD